MRAGHHSQNWISRSIDLQNSPLQHRPNSHTVQNENTPPSSITSDLDLPMVFISLKLLMENTYILTQFFFKSSMSFFSSDTSMSPGQCRSFRAIAQNTRWTHERQDISPQSPLQVQHILLTPPTVPIPLNLPDQSMHNSNVRSLGQKQRWEWERQAKALQLATPPVTQVLGSIPHSMWWLISFLTS